MVIIMSRKKPKIRLVHDSGDIKPSNRKRVISCYVTAEQDGILRELHRITKIPIAVVIREGITKVLLEDYSHVLPKNLLKKLT